MQTYPPRFEAYRSTVRDVDSPDSPSLDAGDELRPEVTSPTRYLTWLMRHQSGLISGAAISGAAYSLPFALTPWLLGKAIDAGIGRGDLPAAAGYAGVMLVLIVCGAVLGVVSNSFGQGSWLNAMNTTQKLVARKVLQLGHVLTRRAPTGEVLSVASSDADTFGATAEIVGRTISALIAFIFVSGLVLSESVKLGLIVMISAPLLVFATSPVMGPLRRAQTIERSRSSRLTGMATDIVAGLRILRGIGGEQTFGDNYARQSQSVRFAGVRTGRWQAAVQGLSSLVSGGLLIVLTWAGAHELLAGGISVGQLISFFGYAIFLQSPMGTIYEFAMKWAAGLVSARKTAIVLRTTVPWRRPHNPHHMPADAEIVDEDSGLVVPPGQLTVIVSAVPDDSAALADRIGRYLPPVEAVSLNLDEGLKGKAARQQRRERDAARQAQIAADERVASGRWGVSVGGVDLADVPLDEVRERIVVSDTGSLVFAGTLQRFIDPLARASRAEAEEALRVANAEDVYDLMPGGWQGILDERGRGLSGGQRQRLVLARALLADPEVLVLVEPTSAVDAHTEARIAARLAEHRSGRTTVITTASPLILRHADQVVLLVDKKVAAAGTHAELLETSAAYRGVVARGMEDER